MFDKRCGKRAHSVQHCACAASPFSNDDAPADKDGGLPALDPKKKMSVMMRMMMRIKVSDRPAALNDTKGAACIVGADFVVADTLGKDALLAQIGRFAKPTGPLIAVLQTKTVGRILSTILRFLFLFFFLLLCKAVVDTVSLVPGVVVRGGGSAIHMVVVM